MDPVCMLTCFPQLLHNFGTSPWAAVRLQTRAVQLTAVSRSVQATIPDGEPQQRARPGKQHSLPDRARHDYR